MTMDMLKLLKVYVKPLHIWERNVNWNWSPLLLENAKLCSQVSIIQKRPPQSLKRGGTLWSSEEQKINLKRFLKAYHQPFCIWREKFKLQSLLLNLSNPLLIWRENSNFWNSVFTPKLIKSFYLVWLEKSKFFIYFSRLGIFGAKIQTVVFTVKLSTISAYMARKFKFSQFLTDIFL